MKMKTRVLIPLAMAASLTGAPPAAAQEAAKDYPSRPIRLLVPNVPGSAVDTLNRIVATKLADVIGQQVVIDNRGGAAGIIAMEIAKQANPDGYTLIAATTAASTVALHLQKTQTFHPVNDYDFIAQFAETPNVLVVHPPLPIKTVPDLIKQAKSLGDKFRMSSAGAGSQSHLSGAYFQQVAGTSSLHVPYKGGGPSVASVVAGESHWTLIPSPAAMSQVNSGRLRAIAHSLPKRTPLLPNIPTIAETLPGFDYSGWMGLFVPKGTPKAIADKVRAAVVKTMETPEVKKGMAVQATEIVIRGPEEFRKVVRESMVQNEKLVKSLGLTAN
jgi:tripartite-type tricarboxylate transporter receptor subunit TctC